jgi:hypothetical protein
VTPREALISEVARQIGRLRQREADVERRLADVLREQIGLREERRQVEALAAEWLSSR